jgi:hypothetical protein
VNFASSYFVVIIVLNLERVVQLQDDGSGADVEDPGLSVVAVVANVSVLDMVVTVVANDAVEEEVETSDPGESEV